MGFIRTIGLATLHFHFRFCTYMVFFGTLCARCYMQYKGIFFSDVDGTLLPRGQKSFGSDVYELIGEIERSGYLFCVSSGRFHISLTSLFNPIPPSMIFSCSNGCRVLYQGKDHLPMRVLDPDMVKDVYETIKEWGAVPMASTEHSIFIDETVYKGEIAKSYREKSYKRIITNASEIDERVLQITCFCPDNRHYFIEKARSFWGGQAHIFSSGNLMFDISPSNKGESLIRISEAFGVDLSQTYAFGDEENDLVMLQTAGLGYLMNTASEDLKEKFPHFCADVPTTIRKHLSC